MSKYIQLIDCIGELSAEKLSIELGGKVYYLGLKKDRLPSALPELTSAIGAAKCQRLIHYWEEPYIQIPQEGKKNARRRMAMRLKDNHSTNKLAQIFGVSSRCINQWLRSA